MKAELNSHSYRATSLERRDMCKKFGHKWVELYAESLGKAGTLQTIECSRCGRNKQIINSKLFIGKK